MNELDAALREFTAGTQDILDNVAFIELAIKIRPRIGKHLNWQSLDPDTRKHLQNFMKSESEATTAYQGLFTRLIASFEALCRRLVYDSASMISSAKIAYDKMAASLSIRNRHCVGRALISVYEPVAHHALNFDELCRDIATCVSDSDSVTLSANAFAICFGGMSVKQIDKMFEAFDAEINWDRFGGNQKIQTLLKVPGTRDATKMVREKLAEFQLQRNGYAHTGVGGSPASAQLLKDCIVFLSALAEVLKSELEKALAKILPKEQKH